MSLPALPERAQTDATDPQPDATVVPVGKDGNAFEIPIRTNRYSLAEFGGAFGDLGTLIPFLVAYVALVKIAPTGILLSFGLTLAFVGWHYRTPFPVQPMKAIGAAAITQTAGGVVLTPEIVLGATLATGLIWLLLAKTNWAERLAKLLPAPALIGVVMGLGFSFMLEGIRTMAQDPWLAAPLLVMTAGLLNRTRMPTMLLLLLVGIMITLARQPELAVAVSAIKPQLHWPQFTWPEISVEAFGWGLLLLALPQLPMTFGNALVAITAENNRLFPDRPVTEQQVAWSTGLMNLFSSAIGGVPMCHGAGGMAGHVRFGAQTGGAAVIMGLILIVTGLFFSDSLLTLFKLFPPAVLGVILFLAGADLALGARDPGPEKADRFVVLTTAAFAVWHVGLAVIIGIVAFHASRKGWLKP